VAFTFAGAGAAGSGRGYCVVELGQVYTGAAPVGRKI